MDEAHVTSNQKSTRDYTKSKERNPNKTNKKRYFNSVVLKTNFQENVLLGDKKPYLHYLFIVSIAL